jgi:signal transduction histidine kinase
LDRLIEDVLSYSKILRGEWPLEAVDLDKLTREILESYPGFQLPEASIKVSSPLPKVVGNIGMLTQCISNLLGNAIKFVRPGLTPQVSIRAEPAGEFVRLWFEDNGIGINSENCDRVFELFQRLHLPEEFAGTGMGLAIVRKATERMGGQVGVESERGRGSKFWLQLRCATQ